MPYHYAIHIKSGLYALNGEYPVLAVVYRYANSSTRDRVVKERRAEQPHENRWYGVVASDKLVASAKFFAERGATWPITLHIDDAHASPRLAPNPHK